MKRRTKRTPFKLTKTLILKSSTHPFLFKNKNNKLKKKFLEEKKELQKSYFLCDFHRHSTMSDGIRTPENIIIKAIKNKYSIIAITDHNNNLAFQKLAKQNSLGLDYTVQQLNKYTLKINHQNSTINTVYLLRGQEITTRIKKSKFHMVVIGPNITDNTNSVLTIDELIKKYDNSKHIIIAAHPAFPLGGIGEKNLNTYQDAIDLVEVNAHYPSAINTYYNNKAKRWAKRIYKPVCANSDAHEHNQYENTFLTLIKKDSTFNENNILGYLLNKFNSSEYKLVEITKGITLKETFRGVWQGLFKNSKK